MQGFKWSIQNLQCSTFLSWGSICFQLLAFNWWSSSNFILIFSMDNCSISQNPAKSWEVGRGCALGFCATEEKNTLALVPLNVKHLCKWLRILLAKQFQQIQAIGETQKEKQSGALLTGRGFLWEVWLGVEPLCPRKHPLTEGSGYPLWTTGEGQVAGPLWQDLLGDVPGHNWWYPNRTEINRQLPLHFHEEGFPAIFTLVKGLTPVQTYICCIYK